jgi:hypothetical protein
VNVSHEAGKVYILKIPLNNGTENKTFKCKYLAQKANCKLFYNFIIIKATDTELKDSNVTSTKEGN